MAPGRKNLLRPACRIAALAALTATSACTDGRPNLSAMAPPPGGLSITTRTPVDYVAVASKSDPRLSLFQCKPLACATPTFLSVRTSPTAARHPDPVALEHYAKVDLPKRILADDASESILSDGKNRTVLASSHVGTVKGFPAITVELRKTVDGKPRVVLTDVIFAGPSMVFVKSEAGDAAASRKNLQLMLDGVTLVEGAPIS